MVEILLNQKNWWQTSVQAWSILFDLPLFWIKIHLWGKKIREKKKKKKLIFSKKFPLNNTAH